MPSSQAPPRPSSETSSPKSAAKSMKRATGSPARLISPNRTNRIQNPRWNPPKAAISAGGKTVGAEPKTSVWAYRASMKVSTSEMATATTPPTMIVAALAKPRWPLSNLRIRAHAPIWAAEVPAAMSQGKPSLVIGSVVAVNMPGRTWEPIKMSPSIRTITPRM